MFAIFGQSVVQADLTVFTDSASFSAATSNLQTEDFESTALASPIPGSTEHDLGLFNIFYSVQGSGEGMPDETGNVVRDTGNINNSREVKIGWAVDSGVDTSVSLEFRFDTPVFAFAAEWNRIFAAANLTITVDGTGDTVNLSTQLGDAPGTFNVPQEKGGFLGFTSTSSFSKFGFSADSTDFFQLDNVQFSTVPEPRTTAVAVGGLLFGLGIVRRFMSRQRVRDANVTVKRL